MIKGGQNLLMDLNRIMSGPRGVLAHLSDDVPQIPVRDSEYRLGTSEEEALDGEEEEKEEEKDDEEEE